MVSWPSLPAQAARLALFSACLLVGGVAEAQPAFFQARVAPILERHCTGCHGDAKQKGGLRLDSYETMLQGGESGPSIASGKVGESDLYRRITLPHDDEEFMPSDGKPPLGPDEIKIIELWIAAGASPTQSLAEFPGAPAPPRPKPPTIPLAPDWRPRFAEFTRLAKELGVRLVPRSRIATDGLVLRTASSPARCDDAVLAHLAPFADLIVEVELARTKVTDAGLPALAAFPNLRFVDLSHTAVSSPGLASLLPLRKLEHLNLTSTKVDAEGVAHLKVLPVLRQVWVYDTLAMPGEAERPKPASGSN